MARFPLGSPTTRVPLFLRLLLFLTQKSSLVWFILREWKFRRRKVSLRYGNKSLPLCCLRLLWLVRLISFVLVLRQSVKNRSSQRNNYKQGCNFIPYLSIERWPCSYSGTRLYLTTPLMGNPWLMSRFPNNWRYTFQKMSHPPESLWKANTKYQQIVEPNLLNIVIVECSRSRHSVAINGNQRP